MAITNYLSPEAVKTMSVDELTAALKTNRHTASLRYGVMLGVLSNARGNVRRINAELKARGLDAKSGKPTSEVRDESGLVAAAVAPLQETAVNHARENATAYVARVVAEYAGKDLNVVAPHPSSKMGRMEYRAALSRRNSITQLLKTVDDGSYMMNRPLMLARDLTREIRFIKDEVDAAGASFVMYVSKLEGKVGAGVTKATVDGKYLWLGSTLTVSKGATVERWHTQQIINRSSLGKAFNQWPTRKMK